MASKQREALDSDIGQLAAHGKKPTEIARLTGKSVAQVYRTLSILVGEEPAPMRGEETSRS